MKKKFKTNYAYIIFAKFLVVRKYAYLILAGFMAIICLYIAFAFPDWSEWWEIMRDFYSNFKDNISSKPVKDFISQPFVLIGALIVLLMILRKAVNFTKSSSKASNGQDARGLYEEFAALAEAHPDEAELRDLQKKISSRIQTITGIDPKS